MIVVFLVIPSQDYGKGATSFSDSALYLAAVYIPRTTTKDDTPKGGPENLNDLDSQISDNTFMPVSAPFSAPTRQGIIQYQVKPGDTLSSIAQAYHLKSSTLAWANNFSNNTTLKPGQTLKVLPVDGIVHTVKKGETVSSISLVYKVYTEDIIGVNNLSDQGLIVIGQELVIPGGSPLPSLQKAIKPNTSSEKILADVRGSLVNPAAGSYKSQGLHWRNAVDLANVCGSPIVAAASGTVSKVETVGWNGGFGKYVMIQHASGVVSVYGHMSQVFVTLGQAVGQGSRIGSIGQTGHATGCHVHFEVRGGVNPF